MIAFHMESSGFDQLPYAWTAFHSFDNYYKPVILEQSLCVL